jgi:IS605 OrfB family transposase
MVILAWGDRVARAIKTLILPLWGLNGVKNAALEATEALFGRIVQFYIGVLLAKASPWEPVPRRDRKTGALKVDPETGEVLTRRPSADEVLTRVEALTLATAAHPTPPHDLASLPGARAAPTVFRRAAIKRAIGLVSSHRSNLERWERLGRKGRMPGLPTVERFPVTIYQGLGLIVRAPLRSYLRVKVWDGSAWQWQHVPLRVPGWHARLMAAGDEARVRVEAVLGRVRDLMRQGRTAEAEAARAELGPLPWEIAAESATLYHRASGWEVHVPVARQVPVRKAEVQRGDNPGVPVTTVDLGVNNLAVAVAWDGSAVTGTLFVPGREHEGRRMRRLVAIRHRQQASGKPTKGVRSNQRRWARLAHAEEDSARQTARQIVDFARERGSKVIVFEALNRIPNRRRMGWTRRQNVRRSWWMRGRILEFVRHMALWDGIVVVRRDPAFTSKACPRCGAYGERFSRRVDGRGPHHTLRCPACRWEGNADLVGALNLKKKWDRTFPALGPLMAAKEAKKAKTALAGLADKSVRGVYG